MKRKIISIDYGNGEKHFLFLRKKHFWSKWETEPNLWVKDKNDFYLNQFASIKFEDERQD